MKLKSIKLKNYKSINELEIEISIIDDSYTYALLGINESGKSSILKAISCFEEFDNIAYPDDFFNPELPIEVIYNYSIEASDLQELRSYLIKEFSFPKDLADKIVIHSVELFANYSNENSVIFSRFEVWNFEEFIFDDYTLYLVDI